MICSRLRLRLGFRGLVGPRCFNLSAIKLNGGALSVKKHGDTENGFAHRVLENLERYNLRQASDRLHQEQTEVLNLSEIQWKNLSGNELCRLFMEIGLAASAEGTPISDSKFNDVCATVAVRCPDMNDTQLKNLLNALTHWPACSSPQEPNFYNVWKAIDNAFVARSKDFKPEKVLQITDLWYQLHLIRKSDFVYQALNRLARRPRRLKSEQVVLLLFYQNVLRTLSKNVKMFPVVERFGEIVHDLTIEEIGVACMGFFKTENPISVVDVVDAIISKLIKNANTVPEITLASIMKAIRYKLPIPLWHRIPELMDTMVTQVDRVSLTSAVHIPLILTGSQTIHENILDAVAEKLIQEVDNARLKDMEKVIYPLMLLNYTPKTSKCVFETVVDQLDRPEREVEIKTWPKCLIAILHYLAVKGIFADHIISRVLDMKFIRSAYGRTNFIIGREILFLDSSMEVENPSYQGNRLPVDVRNYLSRRYSAYLPDPERKMSKQLNFEYDVIQAAERLTGNKLAPKYLLPNHPRADLVLRLSNEGEFLPLPDDFVSIANFTGPIRSPGSDYWALVPLSRNAFIRNLDGLTGETLAKRRQLTLLGFKPLLVLDKAWPTEGSDSEKEEYLKNVIDTSATSS